MRALSDFIRRLPLFENYDKRIEQIMGILTKGGQYNSVTFADAAEKAARQIGAVEIIGNKGNQSHLWKEMLDDLKKASRAKGILKRGGPRMGARGPRGPSNKTKALQQLAQEIEVQVGNTFPDADPFMQLAAVANRLLPDMEPYQAMDMAAKKFLKSKDYHGYISDFFDQYNADNPENQYKNPYR